VPDGTTFANHVATRFRRCKEIDVIAKSIVIALGAWLASPVALADEAGVYIGIGVGYVDVPDSVRLGVPGVPLMEGQTEHTVLRPGLDIGYRFNRNVAIALGYADLGDLKANVSDLTGATDATARVKFSASGVSLALLGTFPIGHWQPYVKAGALFSSTTLKFSGAVAGEPFNADIDNDSEDAIYGLGVRYALSERFELCLDTTYFMEVGEPGHGQADYFKHSLGVIWRF
jgi:opacity protein-like surface antigen